MISKPEIPDSTPAIYLMDEIPRALSDNSERSEQDVICHLRKGRGDERDW